MLGRLQIGRALIATALIASSLLISTLMTAAPLAAAMLHMEPDYEKTEIKATVAEPFGIVRDHPTTTGTFQLIKGEIDGDPAHPATTGHVKLIINATTYNSGSDHRDRAVISYSLETAKYEVIIFDSIGMEDVQIDAPGVSGSATIVGKLTLHGVTRVIKVPVNVSLSTDGDFSADGQVTFNYTDFGVRRPRLALLFPVSDQVTVEFRVIAHRPVAAPPPPAQSRRDQNATTHPPTRLAVGTPVR
jgi:polyisoprenoid-binding protein YceI